MKYLVCRTEKPETRRAFALFGSPTQSAGRVGSQEVLRQHGPHGDAEIQASPSIVQGIGKQSGGILTIHYAYRLATQNTWALKLMQTLAVRYVQSSPKLNPKAEVPQGPKHTQRQTAESFRAQP